MRVKLHWRQSLAFLSKATEIFFGGAAGGGKSHLLRAIALMYCLHIPGVQVYLFRRVSGDLTKNHMSAELSKFWNDQEYFAQITARLGNVPGILGGKGASERAADLIGEYL